MADPSTSLRDTRGGIDLAALTQRLFAGNVPYSEWAGRRRDFAEIDAQRIERAIRSADMGIMWPLTDMAREALALNPKAQGIVGKALLPMAIADHDLTAAEDGLSPGERETAKKIAATVRAMLVGIRGFRQSLMDLSYGFFDGRAALEIGWGLRDGQSWPVSLGWIIPQRLSFDGSRRLIVVDRWGDYGLFTLRGPALEDVPGKFLSFTPRMFADLQEREGLAPRFLFWLLFDRYSWRHRLILCEKFGLPWILIEQAIAETLGALKMPRDDGGEGGAPTEDGAALDYTLAETENVKQDGKLVLLPGQKARLEWPPAEVHEFFSQTSDQILERLAFLALHNSATSAPEGSDRADTVVQKGGEDVLFEYRASLVSEAVQTQLVHTIVELNWGADALPLAPTWQLRTKPERDKDKEVERLTKVSSAVPVGVGVWYEVSGFRPPNPGEQLATPPGAGGGLGGFPGGGFPSPPPPPPSSSSSASALPRGEGSSEDAVGAMRDLLEDADEADQAEAADDEADGIGRLSRIARRFAAPGRRVQPSSANGSPEAVIERGVREALRYIEPWREALLDAADGTDATRIYRNLARVADGLDVERFARALERRLAHGLMLGGLDAHHEMAADVTIEPVHFALVPPGAKGVNDFSTMPFGEAIRAFSSRQVVTKRTFERMAADAKKRAFTVAGLTKGAMLDTAHAELTRALEKGADLRTFRDSLGARFDAAGWTRLNPSHVENVFRTNVLGAYADGRRAQMTQPAVLAARPYWQILGVDDDRTRVPHRAAHGKVLSASDPFFKRSGPPFGFQCRCRVISRSARDLARLGLVPTIGAALRGLPDPGWNADAIAEPFVSTDTAPAAAVATKPARAATAPVVEVPAAPPKLEDLPIVSLPSGKLPPEGIKAYNAAMSEQLAKLGVDEEEAVKRFTHGYDWAIREIDKGLTDAQILSGIEAHRAASPLKIWDETPAQHLAAAKRYHRDLMAGLDAMTPMSERIVYRGLGELDRDVFDAIRTSAHIDIGAVSSTSWNVEIAKSFAGIGDSEKCSVLLQLKTRSGYAIEQISRYESERELLVRKGVRYRVTKVSRVDEAPDRAVLIEAEEI